MTTIRNVLIIDDHVITRMGLKVLFKEMYPGAKADEANSGAEAEQLVRRQQYDFCTMDLNMPHTDALELLRRIKKYQPDLKVLVISMNNEEIYAVSVLKNGAMGFVSKEHGFDIIKEAVYTIMIGKKFMSEKVVSLLIEGERDGEVENPFKRLTERELEIARLMIDGHSTKVIANKVHLQLSTVSTYKAKIFEKLQVSNAIDLYELSRLHSIAGAY